MALSGRTLGDEGQVDKIMQYISTRGQDSCGFEDMLLAGLARDGGLYLPAEWPQLSAVEWEALAQKSYMEIATQIMSLFVGDAGISRDKMQAMVEQSYANFSHPDIAPLIELDDNIHLMELFHGPTLAFKDYAMQFLARVFDEVLQKRGKRAVILGATSGDTGSAALEAFQGRDFADVFILFPKGRVSPVQQKQMTSITAPGVFAVEVEGDFDACQDAVKALFRDLDFRDRVGLTAVNSINWVRLMPQIVYYVYAATRLGAPHKQVAFSVPTGNFGNIFASFAASMMGLPIKTLICASNCNDILTRFFESGTMERRSVNPSLSPSMDIQVSSNFERLLFELLDRDGEAVRNQMDAFSTQGKFSVGSDTLEKARAIFMAKRLDDAGTLAEMKNTAEKGLIIDPHSAVGLSAARQVRGDIPADIPIITLACAHPAKFPDAVLEATGTTPALPPHLADLMTRENKMLTASKDPDAIAKLIDRNRRA